MQAPSIQSGWRLRWLGVATACLGVAPLWLGEDRTPEHIASAGFRHLWKRSPGAVAQFQRALELEPSSPFRWADLGEAYDETGRRDLAGDAFAQALRWGPRVPQIGLRAAWHYFLAGQQEKALAASARVLAHSAQFDDALFSAFATSGTPVQDVLAGAIGDNGRAARQYLLFLLDQDAKAADQAWAHLDRLGAPDTPTETRYAAHLLNRGRYAEAARISHRAEGASGNVIALRNGGFETEWGAGPFDWEVHPSGAYVVSSDATEKCEGKRSLRVRFLGNENVEMSDIGQRAVLPKGKYRLKAQLRTEGVTTDEGVGVRARGGSAARVLASTPRLTGTRDWTEVSAEFEVTAPDNLIRVEIFRDRSRRLVNQIEGIAWVDHVQLEPAR
ncbi:MAG: hypothetical protein R2762_12435 [Bryobacteraceae bacterium]